MNSNKLAVDFKLNNGLLKLQLEPGEEDLYKKLLNDDAYTMEYIKLLVHNRLYAMDEDLQTICRLNGNQVTLIFCENICENENPKLSWHTDRLDRAPQQPHLVEDQTVEDQKSTDVWGDSETRFILDKYELYLSQIGPMKKFKTKKVMWLQISNDLQKILNITKTAIQIENRYKTVLKRKKKAVENNSKSGSSREDVPYEDVLQKISNTDDSIEPEVMRSAKTVKYLKRSQEETCSDSCSTSSTNSNLPKMRKLSSIDQLIELYKKKEEAKEQRHQEKLDLIKQLFANNNNNNE